jgi:hypothetical protein
MPSLPTPGKVAVNLVRDYCLRLVTFLLRDLFDVKHHRDQALLWQLKLNGTLSYNSREATEQTYLSFLRFWKD